MTDNEYNDCPNVRQGYEYWKAVFLNFEQHWQHNFNVIRPLSRPENFAFVHKDALYIGLNLVGGRVQSSSEWTARFQLQLQWVEEMIDTYVDSIKDHSNNGRMVKSIILIGHADPSSDHAAFFDPLVEYIEEISTNSNGEVDDENNNINAGEDFVFLYLNGDSHVWKLESDFFGQSKFLRMQVEGGTRDPPVAITVNSITVGGTARVAPSDVFLHDRRLPVDRK